MKTYGLKSVLIVVLFFLAAGCASTSEKSPTGLVSAEADFSHSTLAVTANLRFDDLPVPVGFKLVQDKSFVFQTENTRVALLKYTGRASLADLIEFYKEQMLTFNWQLLNIVEYERTVLNFERPSQSCIVTIESQGAKKKILTVSLAPKAKGTLEGKNPKNK
ncbi:MAG: hypothetical protein JW714_00235 [Candidatus Omnitrophica bacterium]|nr:hypothetical protein [Candidatus Omnitrophota bacterium]